MYRSLTALGVCLSLALGAIATAVEAPPTDPDVIKGIKLVDDGDFDAAILALDGAARRLASDPSKARDLSQAYLYLGIAYVGKGHEAAAKAKFRDALGQIKDITLSPEKFPPKVIDIFEAARSEAAQTARSGAPPAPAPGAEGKKGGSKKGLLIGAGVAVAAGVGIAVAAGGGGSDSPSTPADTRRTETFTGTLDTDEEQRDFAIAISAAGDVEATATWTDSNSVLDLLLFDNAFNQVGPNANRTANTTLTLVPQRVSPGQYNVQLAYNACNGEPVSSVAPRVKRTARPECTTTFTVTVRHP